ncbi:MAG: PQQ-binding-like beta-propeller repeat protein [Phycisphaerae bacterium]|nr:PQQ-binding-like beta-propeller repeat protein [Phycisphaerae bacterium]NIP52354.1 PQQ-binding-like beta-propeller repeat protein [Phycisphaerae bacterium]NIS51345.1 PQQ-binding-like beta-propeller repeat protein [Phycisphaerae bacterium]NIU08957.1 PQQ-binding-like beta-propeller repeat protein [Phycisphaerae bacterium]NIU56626.1 PQQ-binding-like beta-propeller repeat protein [Phycisphaerae bacterium]
MVNSKSFRLNMCLFLSLFLVFTAARATDWPTYRHDNARTGCTGDSIAAPLTLHWIYTSYHPPRPAWSAPAKRPREGVKMLHRVNFDDAPQVAVVDNMVYFGSSVDNKVYALNAGTGEEHWSFFTSGPVRLAPTVWKDRLLFGSDDGFVYCLKAADGQLIWKKRGGPNDEKLLGNGKMISRWPIRTGVLVDEGIVYFGAGIFPHEYVYLWALCAKDGTVVWKNDTISAESAGRNELSPQGYLLANRTQLFVPSGRSLPVALDRETGKIVFDRKYGWRDEQSGGVIGGTYALLADEQIYTGTQHHLLALDQKTGQRGFAWFPGRRLTVVGEMAYLATGSELVAMNRSDYAKATGRRNSLERKVRNLTSSVRRATGNERKKLQKNLNAAKEELERHRQENIKPTIKWHIPSNCDAELVLTNNLVFAGGQGQVNAFDRESGESVWSAKVDGKARGLAVANERLYVSTDEGKIYCFASGNIAKEKSPISMVPPPPVVNPYPEDKLTAIYEAAAEAIVMETGVRKGYCLVIGAEQGRLAYQLAKRTELRIIGVEPDADKVRAARLALHTAGLYGERVTIDQGNISALPYSNYFANLIVSDSFLLNGNIHDKLDKLARHLKPCGGAICLGMPSNAPGKNNDIYSEKLQQWLAMLKLGQCRVSETNGLWATLKRGPLAGAGKWTHQYAEPGNTACSDDRILSGPLGLLWFGEPGTAPMVNRHDAAASPLAINGRLFIQGENNVMAYDSYNGALLWKRTLPGAMRTRLKKIECSNLAASEDSFFVAVGDKCLRLDAESGRTQATYTIPPAPKDTWPKWGYLAYDGGVLFGSTFTQRGVSDSVFAIDMRDGNRLWTYKGKNIANLTIAIGDGWIFFVDSSLTPEQREVLLRQDKSELKNLSGEEAKRAEERIKRLDARLAVALDARTGGQLWARPVDVTDCSKIGIGGGELTAIYRDGILILCGANANGHYWRQFLSGQFSRRRLVALSAINGEHLWALDANYRHRPVIIGDTVLAEPWAFDLKTGEQKMRRHPLTDEQTPWQFLRPGHHCGAISACQQMLLMRSGFTSYYDLRDDSGIRHFAGHRLGCWINAIAADGLVLAPEASAGCLCLFPIMCTVALEPRPDSQRWGIYSANGVNTPVRRLAVNFGAPGDRRDADGELWLGYPRTALPGDRAAMGFALKLETEFLEGGEYIRRNSITEQVAGTENPWVFTSCGRGLKRCVLPLLGKDDKQAEYTVRLYFAELENEQAKKRIFDIKLQDKKVVGGFDVVKEAGGSHRAVVREFERIRVKNNLEIELIPKGKNPSSMNEMPILCGVKVMHTN